MSEQLHPTKSISPWKELITVVQQLSLARDLPSIMAIVRHAARTLTGADGATFVLRDHDKCFYADEEAIEPLWKGKRFPMSICISGWVMLNRQPVVIPDIYKDPRIPAEAYRPTFVKSLAMVPIRTHAPLGAIGNYWATSHQPTADEVAILAALADTTSVAIENVRVYEELEQRVAERTRELQEANHELDAFASAVSHDLRNPLCAVMSGACLLEEEYLSQFNSTAKTIIHAIVEDAVKMENTIQSLLSLARMNRTELHKTQVNLSELAAKSADNVQRHNQEKQVNVKIQKDIHVQGDATLLQIVMDNLLSNALKYTSKRDDAVIAFGQKAEEPDVLFVQDNGVGFDMAQADKLFAPFNRLSSGKDFPGIGLGLTTVQRIIRRHGGRIWAESTPGVQTTFYFTLKRTPNEESIIPQDAWPEPNPLQLTSAK